MASAGRRRRWAISRSRNIVSVTSPSAGTYGVQLAAFIDPTTTIAVVSPDYQGDQTDFDNPNGPQSIVEFDSHQLDCTGMLEINTGYRSVTTAGSADGDVRSVNNVMSNQPFTIVP